MPRTVSSFSLRAIEVSLLVAALIFLAISGFHWRLYRSFEGKVPDNSPGVYAFYRMKGTFIGFGLGSAGLILAWLISLVT
jgi:hypothetical protein